MGLTRLAIYRPVAIVMMFAALAAMGVVAYTHLPVDRLPKISFPFVRISVSYPGAAPEDVESLVTKPLEDAIIGVNGINTITSTSSEGSANIGINFVEGTDVNQAAIDVARKVDQARRQLPTDAGDPSIFKADTTAFPVMNIAVSSDRLNLQDLYQITADQIQPLIQSVNGVADVNIVGGVQRQVQVRVDPVKLQSYGLSLTQVQNALAQQTGVNSIQVSDDIRKTVAALQSSMGANNGVQFQIVNDQAIFTRAAVDDVQRNLYIAVFLTATVLLLFLHTVRNTLMVLVAIPVSLVSTFFIMYLLGFNLDVMSLMALALLIGILVDDSIVVLENINRHLALGEPPWEAAINGRSEIGLAAIAITFTDVVVYTPVAFMTGNIGQLFREFGLTIVAATLFSLLVSFTLTPMLASRLLKGESLEHIGGRNLWARFTRAWERGFDG